MRCIREALQAERQRKIFFEITLFYWFLPTFVRIFNLEKIYRPTIPSGWDIFRTELYPKMNSDLNLNVWTII